MCVRQGHAQPHSCALQPPGARRSMFLRHGRQMLQLWPVWCHMLPCSFIELLAPDARDALGRPTSQDPSLSRSLALGYTTLNTVLAMLRQGSGGGGTGSGSGGGPNRVVPWRNAPLTRWLQHVLTRADEVRAWRRLSVPVHFSFQGIPESARTFVHFTAVCNVFLLCVFALLCVVCWPYGLRAVCITVWVTV